MKVLIENIKKRFPVFTKNPNLVFFDTAASALKVDSMINAVNDLFGFDEYPRDAAAVLLIELDGQAAEVTHHLLKSICPYSTRTETIIWRARRKILINT